jgi:hypothetical protein
MQSVSRVRKQAEKNDKTSEEHYADEEVIVFL